MLWGFRDVGLDRGEKWNVEGRKVILSIDVAR